MNAPDGIVSPEQASVHKLLWEEGYAVIVCYSLESAIMLITWYLMDHPFAENFPKVDRA
jgi:hypothetical protein